MRTWPFEQQLSLRDRLMLGILVPVMIFVGISTVLLYRQALVAADTAYDRTLLATAKSIGEQLEVKSEGGTPTITSATPLYSALEPFEADNRSRLYYRVNGFNGEMVSGFDGIKAYRGTLPQKGPYAALVDFYDDDHLGEPVRVAVLLQPVVWDQGQAMVMVQVAETLELRQTLARRLLIDTLWRQAALIILIAAVVVLVVQRATLPVRALSEAMRMRAEGDLTPLRSQTDLKEIAPLVAATNHLMARLRDLLETQKRFVRDTSHQLRTPLAVLKAQVQSAQRGDLDPMLALAEINQTVDRATALANQMLALAKVEQLKQQGDAPVLNWADIVRGVALDLAPLIAEQALDFELQSVDAPIRSHEWALRELTRNLLHNALKHCPNAGGLHVRLITGDDHAALTISDTGPGLSDTQRSRLFQPFASGDSQRGSGLGLAICHDIVLSLGGTIELTNRVEKGLVAGLDAMVKLPLAPLPPFDNPVSPLRRGAAG